MEYSTFSSTCYLLGKLSIAPLGVSQNCLNFYATIEIILQRFSNPEELSEEDQYSARERSMWERQFNVLQGQLENTTSLCNTLLRDQQTLISVLLNRSETSQPSRFGM
jgi:hypothetical protein